MKRISVCTIFTLLVLSLLAGCVTSSSQNAEPNLSDKPNKQVIPEQNNKGPSKVAFTAMTFNIRVGAGITSLKTHPYKLTGSPDHLNFISDAIKSVDPDVIGLQEVRGDDQARRLAESLSMNYIYRRHGSHPAAKWWGIAILSKHRLIDAENYSITGWTSNRKLERIMLKCTIEIEGRKIDVYNTHVNHMVKSENQIENILKRVKENKYPAILLGDFNTVPENPALDPLRANLTEACDKVINQSSYFIKVNGTLHPELVRVRGKEIQKFWETSYRDHFRIDYIFYEPKSIQVVDVGLTEKEFWDASDHLGYFARLELI